MKYEMLPPQLQNQPNFDSNSGQESDLLPIYDHEDFISYSDPRHKRCRVHIEHKKDNMILGI